MTGDVRSLGRGSVRGASARGRYRESLRHAPVVVCIPAKNEATRLPAFLDAMATAFRALKPTTDGRILNKPRGRLIIALDGDGDDSRAIIRAAARTFPVAIEIVSVEPHSVPHAGRVRRAAMERGARSFPLDEVILCTTDADTLVDVDWLRQTRSHLEQSDFVCGDIWRDDTDGNIIRAPHEHHYHALHRLRRRIDPVAHDCDDPHPQGFGASLAMRRDTYLAIGGCPNVPSDEDVIMVRTARARGYRVRQPRDVKVLTSSRRDGRATGGLAEALVKEDTASARGEPIRLVDPRRYIARYARSRALRTAFARHDGAAMDRLQTQLQLDALTVEEAWATARSADAFVTLVLPEPELEATLTLDRADMLLRQAEQAWRGRSRGRSAQMAGVA